MAPSYGVLENRTIVDGQASKRIDATSSQYHGLIHPQDLRWTFSLKPGKVDPAIVTEGRSHYFTTEKGEFIFFQIVYANIAIKPSFQVSVRYYAPASDHDIQGINLFYSDNYAFQEGELKGTDEVSGKFGPLIYQVDPHSGNFQVSFAMDRIFMRLDCILMTEPFQVGNSLFPLIKKKTMKDEGVISIKYLPLIRCSGEIHLKVGPSNRTKVEKKQIQGIGCMGYLSMMNGLKPYFSIKCSNYCIFRSLDIPGRPSIAFSMLTFVPTESFTQESHINQGLLLVNGKIWGLSSQGNSIEYGPHFEESVSSYKLPSWIKYECRGVSREDPLKTWKVSVRVQLRHFLDKIDLLGTLPGFLSAVVRLFITNPWTFLFLENRQKAFIEIPSLSLINNISMEGIFYHEISYFSQPKF